jgi:hypothetical protein
MQTSLFHTNEQVTSFLRNIQDEAGLGLSAIFLLMMLISALYPLLMSGFTDETLDRAGIKLGQFAQE